MRETLRAITVPMLLLASCSLTGDDLSDDVLFLTQAAPAEGVMQALYEGDIVARGKCLRLASLEESHTVVWPHGFTLGGPGRDWVITDQGRMLGRIGGRFRLGGGEVPTLWKEGPVDESLRQQALDVCPGRFWLVGETDF